MCCIDEKLVTCRFVCCTDVTPPELYTQSAEACTDACTKLLFKLSEILGHWFALCLELLDLACHALHVQELCNAVIDLETVNQLVRPHDQQTQQQADAMTYR